MAAKVTLLSIRPGAAPGGDFEPVVNEYLKRCGRAFLASARVFRAEKQLLDWVNIERGGGAFSFWIADLGGSSLTSEQFAQRVGDSRDNGLRHVALAVGPADGWSAAARSGADLRLSLGAMTLPHELARLVLAEQIYRASTILQGHPYHSGH